MDKIDDPLSIYIQNISNAQTYNDVFDPIRECSKGDDLVEDYTIDLLKSYDDRILSPEFAKEINDKINYMKDLNSNITVRYILTTIMKFIDYKDHTILWDNIYKYSKDEMNLNIMSHTISERKACERALNDYVDLNYEVDKLKSELKEKDEEIDNLKLLIEHYKFKPGGDGYLEAKNDFDNLKRNQVN